MRLRFDRRRLGILAGLAAFLAGMATLRPALARLYAARDRGALLDAIGRHSPPSPVPLLATADVLKASSQEEARERLRLLLRNEAIRQGGLVERLVASGRDPAIASIAFESSGQPRAILRFAGTIENHIPVIRFAHWRLVREGKGHSVRLEAVAVAPWLR